MSSFDPDALLYCQILLGLHIQRNYRGLHNDQSQHSDVHDKRHFLVDRVIHVVVFDLVPY